VEAGRPQEALLCAKAKRQQLFYLCESVATATTNVFCSESKAAAANVFCAKAKRQQQMFSARKRSVSSKAPSRNGNQPHVLVMIPIIG